MKKVNFERRKLLKIGLFSLLMFLFSPIFKVFGKERPWFFEDSLDDFTYLKNGLKFKSEGENIAFYNSEGKKIFTLTKDGEMIIGE